MFYNKKWQFTKKTQTYNYPFPFTVVSTKVQAECCFGALLETSDTFSSELNVFSF